MSEDPKALFDAAVQGLDPGAANRLRQARRAALAGPVRARPAAWLPALAATAVLVLGLAWWLPRRDAPPAPVASVPTVAATATEDAAELAEDDEDADLYAWLAEAPVAAETDDAEQRL